MLACGVIPPSCLFTVEMVKRNEGETSWTQKGLDCTDLSGEQEEGGKRDQAETECLEVEEAAKMLDEIFWGDEVAGVEELGLNPKRLPPCHTNHVKFMKPLKVYENDELNLKKPILYKTIKPKPI